MYDKIFQAFLDVLPEQGDYRELVLGENDDPISIEPNTMRLTRGTLLINSFKAQVEKYFLDLDDINLLFLAEEDILPNGKVSHKQLTIICSFDFVQTILPSQHYFINGIEDLDSNLVVNHFSKFLNSEMFNEGLKQTVDEVFNKVKNKL